MGDDANDSTDPTGITEEDLERIEAYLHLRPSKRTPDALRPPLGQMTGSGTPMEARVSGLDGCRRGSDLPVHDAGKTFRFGTGAD